MSDYRVQHVVPVIGATLDTDGSITLSPKTLTADYADTIGTLKVTGALQLALYVRYQLGSGETNNNLNLKIEYSPDGTNWYQEASEAVSTNTITQYQAVHTFAGASATDPYSFRIGVPVADITDIRISCAEANQSTNFGTVSVLAVWSGR